MKITRTLYPEELKNEILDQARQGKTPEELSGEFEPTELTIERWLREANRQELRHPNRSSKRFAVSRESNVE